MIKIASKGAREGAIQDIMEVDMVLDFWVTPLHYLSFKLPLTDIWQLLQAECECYGTDPDLLQRPSCPMLPWFSCGQVSSGSVNFTVDQNDAGSCFPGGQKKDQNGLLSAATAQHSIDSEPNDSMKTASGRST